MEAIDPYKERAEALNEEAFGAALPKWIFLKRGKKALAKANSAPNIGFKTTTTDFLTDPYPERWQLVQIQKRAGNPFPERITIGRAPNCDIVLRLPFVSKVHAHLTVGAEGSLELRDNGSTHETTVNGQKLDAKTGRVLRLGDAVSFGALTFELVDAPGLYRALRYEINSRPIPPTNTRA